MKFCFPTVSEPGMGRFLVAVVLLACGAAHGRTAGLPTRDVADLQDDGRRHAWNLPFAGQIADVMHTARQKIGSWDESAVISRAALERIWQQRGTGSDSDLFARDLTIRTAQIPPWDVVARLDCVVGFLQERYGMDDQQVATARNAINRGILQLGLRHADVLLTCAREAVTHGGLTGEWDDAARIARWADMLQPVRQDVLRYIEAEAPAMIATLDPAAQALARQDLDTYKHWHARNTELLHKWARGNWDYRDVGLSPEMLDPQWLREEATRQRTERIGEAAPADPWTAYVQQFVQHHRLDPGQRQTAWSILDELRRRAADFRLLHRMDLQELDRRLAEASPDERGRIEGERRALLQPIEQMFQELRDRLAALPTLEQRAASSQPAAAARALTGKDVKP